MMKRAERVAVSGLGVADEYLLDLTLCSVAAQTVYAVQMLLTL